MSWGRKAILDRGSGGSATPDVRTGRGRRHGGAPGGMFRSRAARLAAHALAHRLRGRGRAEGGPRRAARGDRDGATGVVQGPELQNAVVRAARPRDPGIIRRAAPEEVL